MTSHLVSPLSRLLSLTAPSIGGFLGLVGGDSAQPMLVCRDEGLWGTRSGARRNRVGAISWRGKHRSGTSGRRHVLSYHGPNARLLATDFVYGSDNAHRDIYYDGGLCGIAPGPVLGAALKLISEKTFLIVVCLGPLGEAVYARPFGGATYGNDPDALLEMASMSSAANPKGWSLMGLVGISGYDRPDTPWFFNESGTEAQCMRAKDKAATIGGTSVQQRALDRFMLSLGDFVTLQPMGNLAPFEFKEEGVLHDKGIWISPPWFGQEHYWHEKTLETKASTKGEQIVAVDYVGDNPVLVRYVADTQCVVSEDYMKGVDGDYLPMPERTDDEFHYRNHVGSIANRYSNPLKIGVDDNNRFPGGHMASTWFNLRIHAFLAYVIDGSEYRIPVEVAQTRTQTEYAGWPSNPRDTTVFNRSYTVRNIRHLDVRGKGLVVFRYREYDEMLEQEQASTDAFEGFDFAFDDSEVFTYLEGERVQQPVVATYHPVVGRYPGWDAMDVWEEIATWGTQPWSWSAQTYDAKRPPDNDQSAKGKLPVNAWFPEQSALFRGGWYGLESAVRSPFLLEGSSFCALEDGSLIITGVIPHPSTQVETAFTETEPEYLASKLPAAQLNPVGEI